MSYLLCAHETVKASANITLTQLLCAHETVRASANITLTQLHVISVVCAWNSEGISKYHIDSAAQAEILINFINYCNLLLVVYAIAGRRVIDWYCISLSNMPHPTWDSEIDFSGAEANSLSDKRKNSSYRCHLITEEWQKVQKTMTFLQDCSISRALAMEIPQSCTKPSMYSL